MSRQEEVRAAAREAATRALVAAGLREAGCLFVAGSVEHFDEALELCAELRAVAGASVQVIGGAVNAVTVPGDAREDGPALGVLALERAGHAFAWSPDDQGELRAAAQAAGPGALGLVLVDPAAPVQRLLAALGREAGAVRFCGGGVVAEGGLLLEDDLAECSAVGLIFPGPCRVAVAQSHQPIGSPHLVTHSEGRMVVELNGKPAAQALAALGDVPGLRDLEGALPFLGLGVAPAPGDPFREDDFVSVSLVGIEEDTGALAVGATVAEGSSVCFTLRDGMGARRALSRELAKLAGPAPDFGVYFDCASRGSELYGVDGLDLTLIEKSLGAFPLLSLRTAFELGPAGGGLGMHLFTGVLALSG